MARFLYGLLLVLLIPALIARLLWRARKQPEYLQHLKERGGFYGIKLASKRPLLWLHSVSVGESRAAQPLIKALHARFPEYDWLITCMTPTGRATALELYGQFATIAYLPYDFCGSQRRFLQNWQPTLGLLMETEIWPNLLHQAQRLAIPIVLVNARLSQRSARGYQRIAALARPAIASLAAIAAQTPEDAKRLALMGAKNITVCGNLKFEVHPAPDKLQLGRQWKTALQRPIWLAASTREGEEALILSAYQQLQRPDVLLMMVPRHPQRFTEVAALIRSQGLSLQHRSLGLPSESVQVWLGDSMGEMAAYFAAADFCVMGGSLLPFGSQNLIEACACGCPVLLGPSDFNFAQAAKDAIASGAAWRINPSNNSNPHLSSALSHAARTLIDNPEDLAQRRIAAQDFAAAHTGATERTLKVLLGLQILGGI